MSKLADSPYHVEIAPGCYGGPWPPIVSRHRSWDAAVKAARKSDRLVAVNRSTGERYQIHQQNDPRCGWGRYGRGIG